MEEETNVEIQLCCLLSAPLHTFVFRLSEKAVLSFDYFFEENDPPEPAKSHRAPLWACES